MRNPLRRPWAGQASPGRGTGGPIAAGPRGHVPSRSGGPLASSPNPRRPRALLVDDDPFVLAFLSELLAECGIETLRASDGRIGLQVLADELPAIDLLVTDLVMPELGGDALVMAVRELTAERDLPIVVASSFLDEERARALRIVGADAVVDKQGGLAPVVAAARSLLASRAGVAVDGESAAVDDDVVVDVEVEDAEAASPALVEARGSAPNGAPVPLFRIGLTRRQ